MPDRVFTQAGRQFPPATQTIGITEAGLAYEGETLLVRMRSDAYGRPALAIGTDQDRLLAMLSIAYRRPVAASEVVAKVEAAADLWRRGEKALANLRLMYADLAGLGGDPTAGPRVALAAHLLDQGWSPVGLLEELDLAAVWDCLGKYNPNHVSAGQGRRSGQFDFKSGSSRTPGAMVVAGEGNDKEFELRELLGETTPKEELEHHHPITITPPIPVIGGALFRPTAPETGAAAGRQLPSGIGPGPFAGRSVPAGPSPRPDQGKQVEINAIGRDTGCHTCGTTNPGTASGNFIGDHQPPNSLRQSGETQNYFPHCLRCSRAQGGNVTRFKAHGE